MVRAYERTCQAPSLPLSVSLKASRQASAPLPPFTSNKIVASFSLAGEGMLVPHRANENTEGALTLPNDLA